MKKKESKKEAPRFVIPKKLRLALTLASDIIPQLPIQGDTWMQIAVKGMGMLNTAEKIFSPTTKSDPLDAIISRYDLEETKNEQFVSLFFDTNLDETFNVHRFSLTDYLDVIDASHKNFGRLFFVEYSYYESPESSFYHSKGMDFSKILTSLWDNYNGRLHVGVNRGRNNGTKTEFTAFNECPNPLYGSMQKKMDILVAKHKRFVKDKIQRSYMFYGLPGTGKSSFAMQFAQELGGRTLKMDASSFSHAHVKDVTFLLDNLKPDFFVVDDVDKADISRGLPTLLEILQRFKLDHGDTSVLLTANAVARFDPGLLRPGRIDTWVDFPLPGPAERLEVLTSYVKQFKNQIKEEDMVQLVKLTEGLSQDYLRELAQLLRYDEIEHIVTTVKLMQKLQLEVAAQAAKTLAEEEEKKKKDAEEKAKAQS
jgi:hypothetical protein